MTIWQIALCDLARQLSSIRRLGTNWLKAVGAASLLAAACLSHPTEAKADCEVMEYGIHDHDDLAFQPDPMRKTLAKMGIGIGGAYYGEAFGNWGGVKQGVDYDGLLELEPAMVAAAVNLHALLQSDASQSRPARNSITVLRINNLYPRSVSG